MKTLIITSDSSENHLTGDGHPEQPKRVKAIVSTLKKNKELAWGKSKKFDQKILETTHEKHYLEQIKNSFPKEGFSFFDGDTVVSPGSKKAVYDAAGSIISAIDEVEKGKFSNAFCAVRPPGHHAERKKAMGFCTLNNCSVGANYLISKYNYDKVAIIDFDVHHGNGTQDIFFENEKVLYISTHQYPFYPGTGSENEKGKFNNIFNIPLPAGTSSNEYLNAYERVIKRLVEYKPQFIIFSAGFDAHENDPLAQFKLQSNDFYEITRRTLTATKRFTSGKVVSILEGGYDLNALAESVNEHVNALLEFS